MAGIELQRVRVDAESAFDPAFADCVFCFDAPAAITTLQAALPPVEAALWRLAAVHPCGTTPPKGLRCRSCDLPLAETTTCDTCRTGHCPYCGVGARCWTHDEPGAALGLEECQHVVAAQEDWGGEWRVAPFGSSDLPCLPERLGDHEWTATALRAAFGDLVELLDAYDGDLAAQPDSERLFAAWSRSAPVPLVAVEWTDGNMCEIRGEDYYSPNPVAFHRAADRVVRGLERGFRRLGRPRPTRAGTAGSPTSPDPLSAARRKETSHAGT